MTMEGAITFDLADGRVAFIPKCFTFNPTDEELVLDFLMPKATGQQMPWNLIVDKIIYGDHTAPWEIFNDGQKYYWMTEREGRTTKRSTFVFSNLTKAFPNSKGKRISRRAGCSTWHGESCPKELRGGTTGDVIGYMRTFKFKALESVPESQGWHMHEYSLPGNDNVVLCRITKFIKDNKRHAQDQDLQLQLHPTTAPKKHKSAHASLPSQSDVVKSLFDGSIGIDMLNNGIPNKTLAIAAAEEIEEATSGYQSLPESNPQSNCGSNFRPANVELNETRGCLSNPHSYGGIYIQRPAEEFLGEEGTSGRNNHKFSNEPLTAHKTVVNENVEEGYEPLQPFDLDDDLENYVIADDDIQLIKSLLNSPSPLVPPLPLSSPSPSPSPNQVAEIDNTVIAEIDNTVTGDDIAWIMDQIDFDQ